MDAFVRYLDESRVAPAGSYVPRVKDLARDLARAEGLDSGDERYLALAEIRDDARLLAFSFREARKSAGREAATATERLDHVVGGSPWMGDEPLHEAQLNSYDADRRYGLHANAGRHIRRIVRGVTRDLAEEAAAARAQGVPRVTRTSRRLIELALFIHVPANQAPQRRRSWSRLDELAGGSRPRSAQLGYVIRALARGPERSPRGGPRAG